MRRIVHSSGISLIIAVVILVVAILAAPMFVRQEQIKSFIVKHAELPEGETLVLEGKASFGFLPKMYFTAPKVKIVKKNNNEMVYDNVYLGFRAYDLISKNIKPEIKFTKDKLEFSGIINIANYDSLMNPNGSSIVKMDIEKPVPMKAEGEMVRSSNSYTYRNFIITHKKTTAKGNLKVTNASEKNYRVDLNTVVETGNLDDIRRLINFEKYDESKDKFSGNGKIDLDVSSSGKTLQDIENNVNGKGNLSVDGAQIHGTSIEEMIGLRKHDENAKINITKGAADFTIANSIINVSAINANNEMAEIHGKGDIDVPQQSLRMTFNVTANMAGINAQMPVVVSGPFNNISVTPDAGAVLINTGTGIVKGTAGEVINQAGKIQMKNIKIDVDKDTMNKLKDIGKGFGINMGKHK